MQTSKISNLCVKMGIPYPLPLGKDAVLSGSFIWHVLTADDKTTWLPNDADIFCTRSAVPRLREYLLKNGFKLAFMKNFQYFQTGPGTATRTIVEEWAVPSTAELLEAEWVNESRRTENDMKGAYEHFHTLVKENNLPPLPERFPLALKRTSAKFKSRCVQLIIADDPDVKDASELIKNRFDFPTLENWFDGTGDINVSYQEEVAERVSVIRTKKYVQKDHTGALVELPASVVARRLKSRIEKYTQYGLKLLVPDWLQKMGAGTQNAHSTNKQTLKDKLEICSHIDNIDRQISDCDAVIAQSQSQQLMLNKFNVLPTHSFEDILKPIHEKKQRLLDQKQRYLHLFNTC